MYRVRTVLVVLILFVDKNNIISDKSETMCSRVRYGRKFFFSVFKFLVRYHIIIYEIMSNLTTVLDRIRNRRKKFIRNLRTDIKLQQNILNLISSWTTKNLILNYNDFPKEGQFA